MLSSWKPGIEIILEDDHLVFCRMIIMAVMNVVYEWSLWWGLWMEFMNGFYEWGLWIGFMNGFYEWGLLFGLMNGFYEWGLWMELNAYNILTLLYMYYISNWIYSL